MLTGSRTNIFKPYKLKAGGLCNL